MYILKNYSTLNSTNKFLVNNNIKLLCFLFFNMLIEKKYFQFFYFCKHILNVCAFNFIDKGILYFLILRLVEEQEFNLYILQSSLLFNFSGFLKSKKKKRKRYKKYIYSFNKLFLRAQRYNNNTTLALYNVTNFYNSFFCCNLNDYLVFYLNLFFSQSATNINFNYNFSYFSFKVLNHRIFILNYYLIKKMFSRFILLLLNSSLLNMLPFFVYPVYLEKEVLYFYSFFIYLKTSLVYSLGNIKHVIFLKNLSKFKHMFGVPSFFFVVDINSSFKSLSVVYNYKIPVGGLLTSNMIPYNYDYPLFINNWSKELAYIYFIFIINLFFTGFQKRKQFLWHFFIRNRVLYELKRQVLMI